MSLSIRDLTPQDVNDVLMLIEKNYPGEEDGDTMRKEMEQMFSDVGVKPHYFVAEEQGKIVGALGYAVSRIDYDVYELSWIFVDPDFQKQGIGSALMDHMMHILNEAKADTITLSTYHSLASYFEKRGFKTVSDIREEECLMVVKL